MRADCRCENMAFVCFLLFVALRGLHAVRLGGGGLFEEVLCCSSWVDFETVFTLFSEGTALSDALETSHFHCYVAPQIFAKLRSKLQKSTKKFVHTTS